MTGLSAVGPQGLGLEPLARALAAGASPAGTEVDRSAGYHRPGGPRRALLVNDLDLAPLLPANAGRRMSPPARFAVAAARLALDDAGLRTPDSTRTAVISGTAWGPPSVSEQLLLQIFGSGPEAASPAMFTESVASAASSQVALAFQLRGPNIALTQREASGLVALGEGLRQISTGRAERALVVVVDEMIPILHAALARFGALARPDAAGREIARPFDRERDGILASEGAAVLVLEPGAAARRRGARIRSRLLAVGSAFDASAPSFDFGDGASALARRLRRSLERHDLTPPEIDRVVSGASGARRGDALEAALLRHLFAGAAPSVLTVKGSTGEYGGGFLGAALLAAQGAPCGPPAGFRKIDPELGLAPVDGTSLPPPRRTLVTSCAAGGAAAWALLAAGDGAE